MAKITNGLKTALEADYVILRGGSSKKLKKLPPDTRLLSTEYAFRLGIRMWEQ